MAVDFPSVVLHDHLDGGLRASTVAQLATVPLPTSDPVALESWFDQEGVHSLERYLDTFSVTVSAMQTVINLERIAHESIVDLASDGVMYAEIRYAPSLSTGAGLTRPAAIEAICKGFESGERATGLTARLIVDALRQDDDSYDVVADALAVASTYVVGFDLAGPEAGFPASRHQEACEAALNGGLGLTIHAGEADGVSSIADALSCGAQRLGHGVRIIDDCRVENDEIVDVGPTAQSVLDQAVALELCPTSNRHTLGLELADHPIDLLLRAGFAVTVNPDNRLMSRTSQSHELRQLAAVHGWDASEIDLVTHIALRAAFCDTSTREHVLARLPPHRSP